ncbi:sugar phosphate isomerase/epimerase family protein [Peribacillus sp. SCS-155]|uniref:sugar phosphate isomerase/epimerase family protein n=1 Tax=Peribacillus sedimenti TaxID=3115297 RepID=UPI003905C6FA
MMEIGIFAKTFSRNNVMDVIQAIQDYDIHTVQFNMACANLPTLPAKMERATIRKLQNVFSTSNVHVAALSGTFNMIHPSIHERGKGLVGLENLAYICECIGTNIITLCTGSRDANDMWKFHPENNSQKAWDDLLQTMEKALKIAEKYDIVLGIEPELSNVINTASKARSMLDTFQSKHLKIIMDGANLIPIHRIHRMNPILDEAFDLLGEDIILAHAKDLSIEQDDFVAAGQGNLDYRHYLSLLKSVGYERPLIMHGLREDQVSTSKSFLEKLS